MYDGFLSNHTLKELLHFKLDSDEIDELSILFTHKFVDAGLKIEKEQFVELFQKITH